MLRFWVLVLLLCAGGNAQPREGELERLSGQAQAAMAAKKWDDAVKALARLGQLVPSVPEVQANLGLALYFEGRPADALAAFERARKLNPALPQVKVMIGLCDAELGRYPEATAILAPAFEHPPDAESGRLIGLALARSYAELKQYDKALAAGEELIKRYSNDPEILYQVSRLHTDRATALISGLVRTAPDSAWTHYANAQVEESMDRYEAAEREYRKALERDPRIVGAHYRLGRVILAAARTPDSVAKARTEFEQELAISPRNADAEYELGEIDREHGNANAALEHFGRALRYHPDFVEAQVGLAKTLIKMGRAKDAVPHLAEAARLDPGNKIPHYLLATAYKSLGDTAAAAKELAAYQRINSNK